MRKTVRVWISLPSGRHVDTRVRASGAGDGEGTRTRSWHARKSNTRLLTGLQISPLSGYAEEVPVTILRSYGR